MEENTSKVQRLVQEAFILQENPLNASFHFTFVTFFFFIMLRMLNILASLKIRCLVKDSFFFPN